MDQRGKLRRSDPTGEKTPSTMAGRNGGRLKRGNPGNKGGRRPITHGRYSTIRSPRYKELLEQLGEDGDPLNLLPELAAARALLIEFLERYHENVEALLAWHASFLGQRSAFEKVMLKFRQAARTKDIKAMGEAMEAIHALEAATPETPKPRQVLDISDARSMLVTIARLAETIERIRGNVTKSDLIRILGEMGRTVEINITTLTNQLQAVAVDDGTKIQIGVIVEHGRAAIEKGWREISLV